MRLAAGFAYCFMIAAQAATAGEIINATVTRHEGVYNATVNALIGAPLPVVFATITDYGNLKTVNPSIEESRILRSSGPGHYRVHSVVKVCILIYCKRVEQVQDMTHRNNRSIEAVTLPEYSDFRYGVAHWRLTGKGPVTHMYFTYRFEPDFWVPPVIGTWLIKRKLVNEVSQTAIYIEELNHREQEK